MLGEARFPSRLPASPATHTVIKVNLPLLCGAVLCSGQTEAALLHDAVLVLAAALAALDQAQVVHTRPLSCAGSNTWHHGNSLLNYMKLVTLAGLTGRVSFDQHGKRADLSMDVVELQQSGLHKVVFRSETESAIVSAQVGMWHTEYGLQLARQAGAAQAGPGDSIANKSLVVTTIRSPPYSMYRESAQRLAGNTAYEGFAVELIAEIANTLSE